MTNRLVFDVDGKNCYVRMPNQKEINDGELIYKTKYSEALRFGALSAAEADSIIKDREIWSQKDEEEKLRLFVRLHELGDELMLIDKFTDAANHIYEMEQVRTDILRLNMRKSNILDNTAESYADDHRLQFYVTVCSFYADDNVIFEDVDDYLLRAQDEIAKVCMTKLIHLIANDGQDFRQEWPEFKWRIKHGLIDENLNPVKEKMEEFVRQASAETADEAELVAKTIADASENKEKVEEN